MKKFFSSESVTEGHPDKICDQIADAILDSFISKDPESRVACEVAVTTGFVLVMGEITSNANVDIENIVRKTINGIGYDKDELGFSGDTCEVKILLGKQSADISQGVNSSLDYKGEDEYDKIGAGDQGIIFGYASSETEEYMPLALYFSHKLAEKLAEVRKTGVLNYLRPDGKTQVSIEYENGKMMRVDSIIVSTQHDAKVSMEKLREDIKKFVIDPVISSEFLDENTKYYINPTGRFVIGGPAGDSGLTGRKLMVDTYGGYSAHGGGSFSGKDPTKVDRSAAYFLRYVAKNLVAAGLCEECEIQAAYAIGKAKPVSIAVNTFCSAKVAEEKIVEAIGKLFDLRPKAMIDKLDLKKPIYFQTASYGHFGNPKFPWEKCDKVDELREFCNL